MKCVLCAADDHQCHHPKFSTITYGIADLKTSPQEPINLLYDNLLHNRLSLVCSQA